MSRPVFNVLQEGRQVGGQGALTGALRGLIVPFRHTGQVKALVGWVLAVSLSVMLGLLLYSTSLSGSPTHYQEVAVSPPPVQTIVKTKVVRKMNDPDDTAGATTGQTSGSSGSSGGSQSSTGGVSRESGESGSTEDAARSEDAEPAQRSVPRSSGESEDDGGEDRSSSSNASAETVKKETEQAQQPSEDHESSHDAGGQEDSSDDN